MRDFEKLVFFDVETPNGKNDRICSIGFVETDRERNVLNRKLLLVDPEESFSDINMRIHGIAPVDVKGKPTFPEVWDAELASAFDGALLVAHNAAFDLSVLSKDIEHYGIDANPAIYACTKSLAKSICPNCPNLKLPTVCDYLGVDMGVHHRALDDALGCERIFWALVGEGLDELDVENYVWGERTCNRRSYWHAPREKHFSQKTTATRELMTLLGNVTEDGGVSVEEAGDVLAFIEGQPTFENDPSVQNIVRILSLSLSDGDISAEESKELNALFRKFLAPTDDAESEPIVFEGNTFCLSGTFEHGSKQMVQEMIERHEGCIVKSVTRKCSYVVVGGCGNENWSMGSYGEKVKKAKDLQAKGNPIRIIGERELFSAFEG